MKFTTEDEPDLTIPDDTLARAQLLEVQLRTFEWDDRKTKEKKSATVLEWWWEIRATRAGEQYIGRRVRGTCDAKLSNRGDNKFRIWSESLLGREIPVGMSIDTDDLVGLEAEILISTEPDKKDPHKLWNRVTDIISPISGSAFNQGDPPF